MIKWLLGFMFIGFLILDQEWPFPRTYWDNVIMLLGYILLFGPGFLVILAIFNRLVNLSFKGLGK